MSDGFLESIHVPPLKSPSNLPEGDGELVYPGVKYGVETPCASIRLERWLDGAEDYELLSLYQQKHGRAEAESILSHVYTNSYTFESDPVKINEFKVRLIEGVMN